MKLVLEMSLNNAAYREYAPYPDEGELDREMIAKDIEYVAEQIRAGNDARMIIDINGNRVGQWRITND